MRTMKHKIMVVDDSRMIYAEMQKMLEGSGIEIASYCRSGEEALAAYEKVRPELVTLDIVMPGMDGLDVCREMLARWPDAQVLIVSSLAYDDTIECARTLGAKGFLYKPFERGALLESLHKALHSERSE